MSCLFPLKKRSKAAPQAQLQVLFPYASSCLNSNFGRFQPFVGEKMSHEYFMLHLHPSLTNTLVTIKVLA